MKFKTKLFKAGLFALLLLSLQTTSFSQNIGDYQAVTTGAWGTAANWRRCVTAGTWTGATSTFPPIAGSPAATTITILSGVTITSGSNLVNSCAFTINSGGALSMGTFTLTNNASCIFTNNGTFTAAIFNNNGTFNNNLTCNLNNNNSTNGATGIYNNAGTITIAAARTLTNSGAIANNGTIAIVGTLSQSSASFNNGVTGTINNTGTLTIPSTRTLTNNGTIISAGTINSGPGFGTLNCTSTGIYQHNFSAAVGTVPTANWSAGSTCEILNCGTSGAGPNGLGQTFSDFIWNYSTQTVDVNLNATLNSVRDFTIKNTGTQNLVLHSTTTGINTTVTRNMIVQTNGSLILTNGDASFGSSGPHSITVAGDYNQTGGTCALTSSTGTGFGTNTGSGTITVTGNLNLSGGTLNLNASAATSSECYGIFTVNGICNITGGTLNLGSSTTTGGGGTGTLNVSGNFVHTAGAVSKTGTANGIINIKGTTAQSIQTIGFTSGNAIAFNLSQTGASGTTNILSGNTFVVNNGTTFTVNNNPSSATELTVAGTFETRTNTWSAIAVTPANPFVNVTGTFYNYDNNLINVKSDSTTLSFASTAFYKHNANGGQVPTASWNSASTLEVMNGFTTSDSLGNGGQRFGNIIWNTTAQTTSAYFGKTINTRLFLVQGNFTVSNTGSGTLRFPDVDFPISGNFTVQNAAVLQLANGPGLYTPSARHFYIYGDMSVTGTAQVIVGKPNTTVASVANSRRMYYLHLKKNYTYSSTTPIISFDQRTFGGTTQNESYIIRLVFDGGITQTYSAPPNASNLIAGSLSTEFISNNTSTIQLSNWTTLVALSDMKYFYFLIDFDCKLDLSSGTNNLIHYQTLTNANAVQQPQTVSNGSIDFGLGQLSDATGTGTFTFNAGGFWSELTTKHAGGIMATGAASGCILVTGTRSYSSGAYYTYNGSSPQVTGTGLAAAFSGILKIANTTPLATGGVTLSQATTISGGSSTLNLTAGRLITTSTNLLTIAATPTLGVTPAGGSATSFVDGPIKRFGTGSFIFPTGDVQGSIAKWARTEIVNGIGTMLATDGYTAEYTFTDPHALSITYAAGITDISYREYWKVTRSAGTACPFVKLYWEDGSTGNSGSGINSIATADLQVVELVTGTWNSRGSGGTTGTAALGTILSGPPGNTFTNGTAMSFTLTSPSFLNPLPIELLSFTGEAAANGNQLYWSTATEINNDYFELERSVDAETFVKIAEIDGHGNSSTVMNYEKLDVNPVNGMNYYRLKQVDYDGEYTYSSVIGIDNKNDNNSVIVYPNPTTGNEVTLALTGSINQVIVYNVLGEIVYQKSNLQNTQILNLEVMSQGVYIIKAITSNNEMIASKFTKN